MGPKIRGSRPDLPKILENNSKKQDFFGFEVAIFSEGTFERGNERNTFVIIGEADALGNGAAVIGKIFTNLGIRGPVFAEF